MRIEIERKAWVRDPDGLREALEERYGQPKEVLKCDRYYIEPGVKPDPSRRPQPRIARLRREGTFSTVTAKQRDYEGDNEINREIEFVVDDPQVFEEFIQGYLGFEILVDKIKHTWKFKDNPLTLELSNLRDLGWFFEAEYLADGEKEREEALRHIDGAFKRFGEFLGDVETEQYIVLLMRKAGRIA